MTLRICLRISDPSARRRIANLLRKDPEVELVDDADQADVVMEDAGALRLVGSGGVSEAGAQLTTREREVLKMLAEGNSVKEIACDLNLSVKTVEAHKFNLMRKLDIHNKAQLVQYAIQKKIIKIPNLV